jgi:hypothetical protein
VYRLGGGAAGAALAVVATRWVAGTSAVRIPFVKGRYFTPDDGLRPSA